MKLIDLLSRAGERWIRHLSEVYSITADGAIDHLHKGMINSCRMAELLDLLNTVERTVLAAWTQRIGTRPADEAMLERIGTVGLSGAEFRFGLHGLCRKGIVFPMRKTWGDRLYAMPADTYPIWVCLTDRLRTCLDAEVQSDAAATGSLEEAIYRLLAEVDRHPIPVTRTGAIHKKAVHALEKAIPLALGEPKLALATVLPERGEPLSGKLGLLLDLAARLGCLHREAQHLVLEPSGVERWLDETPSARRERLWDLWWTYYRPTEPDSERLAGRLVGMDEQCWYDAGTSIEHALNVIAWPKAFGWVESGRQTGGALAVRKLAPLEHVSCWYVQPDMTVYVPPGVPYRCLWELEAFAEYQASDQFAVYKLTGDSIRRGIERGMDADRMIACLETGSGGNSIEPSVKEAVLEWVHRFGRARLEQVWVLQCKDPETAVMLERDEEIIRLRVERLTDLVWFMDPAASDQVRSRLDKLGVHASTVGRRQADGGQAEPEDSTNRNDSQGLFPTRASSVHYQLDAVPEGYESLAADVPTMWLKDLRAYHPSTGRTLIETAITKQAPLRLRHKGKIMRFVPFEILEDGHGWCVDGAGETGDSLRLQAGEWEEMQLILPGINDTY